MKQIASSAKESIDSVTCLIAPGVLEHKDFKRWALPICIKLMVAMFEKYISPETWEKTIASMRGRRTTHAGAGAEGFAD